MGDPLRPFNKREQLFVSCLTDISHGVIWLQETGHKIYERGRGVLGVPLVKSFRHSLLVHNLPLSSA